MDTPFNQSSYIKLMQDQQTRNVGDVVANPSVRNVWSAVGYTRR
jgi:hypothetical protein